MAGHSKWAQIKHQKSATDARRGQLFTKLAREITLAARKGIPDPTGNYHLRLAVQKARDHNMPMDNIERAIKRAAGGEGQAALEETHYEGYGPGGIAIIVHAVTDNRNRTASEVRSTFTRAGGNLAEAGAVAWNFESKGVVTLEVERGRAEDVALLAIDAGADDVKIDGGYIEVYTAGDKLEPVRKELEEKDVTVKSAELSMVPKTVVTLGAKHAEQVLKLLDALEELGDVQKVYSNADFPEEVLQRYGGGS